MSWLWIYLSGQRSARLITQGDAVKQAGKIEGD
jgi:NADH dehydrogenase